MTDQEIVDGANLLARLFYREAGYLVPEGYRFDKARHPQEKLMWRYAVIAFEQLRETDADEALSNVEDDAA